MTSSEFWAYVEEEKVALIDAHRQRVAAYEQTQKETAFKSQPKNGKSLFMVSKRHLERGTSAGIVSEATLRLAAQRFVEQTHELATPEQIKAHLFERETEKEEIKQLEQAKKQQFVVNVTPGQSVGAPGPTPAHAQPGK